MAHPWLTSEGERQLREREREANRKEEKSVGRRGLRWLHGYEKKKENIEGRKN